MDWEKVDKAINSLIVKLWLRYRKYKTKCQTKKKIVAFCTFMEKLKIHAKCKELDLCVILIKKSTPPEKFLYKHKDENLDDYRLLKKSMNEEWQTILILFGLI
tara:strand:- start:307 stop:615 length:309 start_codon:yes stop_codon:yes gene_type:complete